MRITAHAANQHRMVRLQARRLTVAFLGTVLLASLAPLASAQVFCPPCQSFTFSIGPLQGRSYVNNPNGPPTEHDTGLHTFGGSFRGYDGDGDGHIGLAELIEFHFGGLDFPNSPIGPGPYGSTFMHSFDYSPSSGLNTSASNARFQLNTGVSYAYHAPGGGSVFSWRPDTVTAVPEPAGWMGLAAGLAFVLARQRRTGRVNGRMAGHARIAAQATDRVQRPG